MIKCLCPDKAKTEQDKIKYWHYYMKSVLSFFLMYAKENKRKEDTWNVDLANF